jgi:hypothetical protein
MMVQTLPPHRRLQGFITFVQSLIYGLKYDYGNYQSYQNGFGGGLWSNATTYNKYDLVQYNFKVYYSIVNGNISHAPSDPAYWREVLPSFIGATERTKYSASKIVFEYALNKEFGTTFKQPPLVSDIYINNIAPAFTSFLVGIDTDTSDYVGLIGSSGYVTPTEIFTAASSYEFTINIPTAVYSALGTAAEQIIRKFADKYAIVGTFYNIVTY